MQLNKKSFYVMLSIIVLSCIMAAIDAFVQPGYLVKSIIKIILFLLIPAVFFLVHKSERHVVKNLFALKKTGLVKSLGLGITIFVIIIIGYLIFKRWIDFGEVTNLLTANAGVNKENFVFVSLYISFINSFLEEIFFRGFGFITLKKYTNPKFAYIFSSGLFAFYHVGMTLGWWAFWISCISMLGLFVGGLIFDWLDSKYESIYPSWIAHMFTNFAINTVGFIIFGII